jgi:hypothetical protein
VSSSLRRVCWELVDPTEGLEEEKSGVTLMECFQPQLAQFQQHSFQKMIDKLGVTDENPTFWIEEKLDGERMQLHKRMRRLENLYLDFGHEKVKIIRTFTATASKTIIHHLQDTSSLLLLME